MTRTAILIASFALVSAACSGAGSPTAPTPKSSSNAAPQSGTGSPAFARPTIVERDLELAGTWTGAYTIPSCWPTTAPNACTGYAKSGTLTLTLTRSGNTLTGVFQSGLLGNIDVSGNVDDTGTIRLGGQRTGSLNCFAGLGPLIVGVTGTVEGWTARINRTGGITASFKQTARQRISSCYYAMYEYPTVADDIRRDLPPAKTVIDRP